MPKRPKGQLTLRERSFVTALLGPARGNATQAALLAGYSAKSAAKIGSENLQKPEIANFVDKALQRAERKHIADAVERDELLTGMLRNPFLEPKTRMRAVAELNRVEGRHIKRHLLEGHITYEELVSRSREGDKAKA